MFLKRFNEAFGLQDSITVERQRFVQRTNDLVWGYINHWGNWKRGWLQEVCIELGIGMQQAQSAAYQRRKVLDPTPQDLTGDDFDATLKLVCVVYHVVSRHADNIADEVDQRVRRVMSLATVDLGVTWNRGMFYPSGAEFLDHGLIEDPFRWLDAAPEPKELFRKSVVDYAQKRYSDSVAGGFKTLERLAAITLGNERTLDNNKGELLQRLGISPQWRSLLNNFMQYANDFARHASQPQAQLEPAEVEAFLYLAGVFVRLILKAKGKGG